MLSPLKKKILFILMGAALLAGSILIIRAVNNRGENPYIYLKMDEGHSSTTYDAMGHINATLQGDATWKNENECLSGKCLYLDGTGDYLSIPDFSLE